MRESRQLWAFSIKAFQRRDPRPATPESTGQATSSGPSISALQAISLGFWGWGVYLVSSAAQPKSTGSPTILRGRPLFDAQLSRPATSSSFLSCGVNPPPFLLHIHHGETHCKLSHVHNESPASSGSTSHLGPASVPSTRCSRLSDEPINSGTLAHQPCQCAVTRASASHVYPSRVTQTICIIVHACELFSLVLTVDLRRLLHFICACFTLHPSQSALER